MIPLTLPLIEAHLTQINTLHLHHQEKATDAHNHELVMNDLIAATEVHTLNSFNIFKDLRALYLSVVALHPDPHTRPLPMASLDSAPRIAFLHFGLGGDFWKAGGDISVYIKYC